MSAAAALVPPSSSRTTTDRGLDRVLDLDPAAVRRRTVRRRLAFALSFAPVGLLAVAELRSPDRLLPFEQWPSVLRPVGLGFMVLAVVLALVAVLPMVRSGINPFDNRDPARILSRSDHTWVRARIAAGAPVGPDQQTVVARAADWMARQPGTVPAHLGTIAMGLGLGLGGLGAGPLLVGLLLILTGIVRSALAVGRARTARRWLAFYAPDWLD